MIKIIKKSKKEYKCSKCGKVIPEGTAYIRGELNFCKPIIRCTACGLRHYEVTSSDYVRSVGPIVEDWTDNYEATEEGRDMIVDDLETIKSEVEERLENMPEGLREGDTGLLLQERIDYLDSAIDELNNIDFDDEDCEDFEELITDALSCIDY